MFHEYSIASQPDMYIFKIIICIFLPACYACVFGSFRRQRNIITINIVNISQRRSRSACHIHITSSTVSDYKNMSKLLVEHSNLTRRDVSSLYFSLLLSTRISPPAFSLLAATHNIFNIYYALAHFRL